MIDTSDETWATDTLRDAQDPGAGVQQWLPLPRLTLERFNLIFAQQHSRGYATTGQSEHDCATALENGFATLCKVVVGGASNGLGFTKWTVPVGLEYDDEEVVAGANISDTARPSIELTAGALLTIRVFYVGEGDANIYYIESADGADTWTAEQNVGALANVEAIASVSTTKVHCVSYTNGNSRFHCYEDTGSWGVTNSLVYWPHKIEHIDAITVGDRDLIVFYSHGPMYGNYREAGIYGIWYEHGRWSDLFKIDVLDESDAYSYRDHPMLSTANDIFFLTGYLSEGDSEYSHATRFLKTSKDGQCWGQYQPLVTLVEGGPAKLLVINATAGDFWPWSTGQQAYIVGFDKVYESDATRLVGEENADLQVDVSSRTKNWTLQRGVIAQGSTVLGNHDGTLDGHNIINADNTLLMIREAGYRTGAGDEYAQLTLEQVDYIKETDRLPQRHKQVVSRDFMAWVRDREADHYEEWESQLVGYDNYHDDTETGYGGLGHTATQKGWWETHNDVLWLQSSNLEGLAFATWNSRIMNGQVKSMIRIETASNGEYAGVVFRARDEGNFWAAYYLETDDKIHLRQKVGGAWENIVASTSALSWSIDTWYGIMVDFRYSYFIVYYSADGLAWTQAFTYTVPINALNSPLEYGYTGLLGYGYSSEDEDEDPEYEEPHPPPPITPPIEGGNGNLLYFVDFINDEVYRSRNARDPDATAVVYEALSYPGSNPRHITLDSWDPLNTAMVCGDDGVWKTTNLNDDAPTWTCVIDMTGSDLNTNYRAYMAASSICQEGLWMVTAEVASVWDDVYVFYTTNGGDTFADWTGLLVAASPHQSGVNPKIEASSHNAQVAWITWRHNNGNAYFSKTTDQWATDVDTTFGSGTYPANPHHRYLDNPDDLHALWAASTTIRSCTDDCCSCTDATTTGAIEWVGSYTWGTTHYWLLDASTRFYVSDDSLTWTLQYTFPGTSRFISGWPYESERFYACQDGTTAPILISDDRGLTWQAQTGNWAAVQGGSSPDIYNCVPCWTV